MKIFVTGATGFIGRNLTERLLAEGHSVICGIRSPAKLKSLKNKVKAVRIYLEYKETISRALREEKPDVVCHAAALVESASLGRLLRVNREGTRNVLAACLEEGVKSVIYLSTIAVINGNKSVPLTDDLPYRAKSAYGRSKLEAEKIALEYRKKGLKIAILRPCMVYGEGEQHGLLHLVGAVKKRVIPIFGKGDKKIQLVSVENVVDVMVLCLSKKEAYEGTYLVADKEALSVRELLNYIAEVLGVKPPFVIPGFAAVILAKMPFVKNFASYFLKDRLYSIKRLREKLGYTPRISVYDGLKRAVLSLNKD
jgi:nucleoside-diphosphate-sugar epimerase